MNAQLAIDSIVRQVTVLIAQLATSGGIRAPVAHIANQIFVELATELEAQGVSRKVSADMFGMALRAYIRKLRRLREGQTVGGRTLWQAVLDFVRKEQMVTRARLLQRFERDEERSVTAVIHDLTESGLVFASGMGPQTVYRAASEDDLTRLAQLSSGDGFDELVWVHIYRAGPLTLGELNALLGPTSESAAEAVDRLVSDGRVERGPDDRLLSRDFSVPLGSAVGWEAAVFDHFQAMVQTVCQRLRRTTFTSDERDTVGGSTYSFDVWAGHPLEDEVKAQLELVRQRLGALRARVEDHNRQQPLPQNYDQVVTYVGQCILPRDHAEEEPT